MRPLRFFKIYMRNARTNFMHFPLRYNRIKVELLSYCTAFTEVFFSPITGSFGSILEVRQCSLTIPTRAEFIKLAQWKPTVSKPPTLALKTNPWVLFMLMARTTLEVCYFVNLKCEQFTDAKLWIINKLKRFISIHTRRLSIKSINNKVRNNCSWC